MDLLPPNNHIHCSNCIMRNCSKGCLMSVCPNKCGSQFHQCKFDEHKLLCENEISKCINSEYGCPVLLVRSQRGIHLETCPASVISCSRKWTRWTIQQPTTSIHNKDSTEIIYPLASQGNFGLDLALALRDWRSLNLQKSENSSRPKLRSHNLNLVSPNISSNFFSNNNKILVENQNVKTNNTIGKLYSELKDEIKVDLIMQTYFVFPKYCKFMDTFYCNQDFRRDQYCHHEKTIHVDIYSNLNGWMETRCPLHTYGCDFVYRRIIPPKNFTLTYGKHLESFGIAKDSSLNLDQNIYLVNSYNKSHLLQNLPFEILQYICTFLDSFSLNSLALTNTFFRHVCCSLLDKRGIVVAKWEKQFINGSNSWNITKQGWRFTSAICPIDKWDINETNQLSNHLKSCHFFERTQKIKPFNYIGLSTSINPKKDIQT